MSELFLAQVLLMSDLRYKEGLLCVARKLWGEVVTSGQEQETAAVPQRQELGLWTEWRLQGWILVQTGSLLGETAFRRRSGNPVWQSCPGEENLY